MVILAVSFTTGDKRISLVTSRTPTGGSITCWDIAWDRLAHWVAKSVDIALSVWSTRTWIARIWRWGSDLNLAAASDGVRLRLVTWEAGTDWVTLPVLLTLSVGATGAGVTRIWLGGTSVVVTDIARTTVWVYLTLPPTARDGVWHGDISCQ